MVVGLYLLTEVRKLSIESRISEWRALVDKENSEKAREVYRDMLPDIVENVRKTFLPRVTIGDIQEEATLFASVGFSPEPLVLSISAIRPKKVFFIQTKQSERTVNEVVDILGLKPEQFRRLSVSNDDVDVYREVKRVVKGLESARNVFVDITGGTKLMSGGLSLIAAIRGFNVVYLRHRMIKGNVEPMSENLVLLRNPYDVFGDLEIRDVIERVNLGRLSQAIALLEELEYKVADPRPITVLADYCRLLEDWDSFKYDSAFARIGGIEKRINQYGVLLKLGDILSEQKTTLERLSHTIGVPFFDMLCDERSAQAAILDMYSNADRRMGFGMLADASLRFYRTVELVSQHRLAKLLAIDSGDTTGADLNSVLISEYNKLKKDRSHEDENLPERLGLIEGFRLLLAARDPCMVEYLKEFAEEPQLDPEHPGFVTIARGFTKYLISCTEERNQLTLIHGWNYGETPKRLPSLARGLLLALLSCRETELEEELAKFCFPRFDTEILELDKYWSA